MTGSGKKKRSDGNASDRVVDGRATPDGTRRLSSRFRHAFAGDFYRETSMGLIVSSIGMGTYLGECDDREDVRYARLLATGIANGLNVLDTAINYRCQRSERAAGRALKEALASGNASRDEIVVCTKGGYVPLEGSAPDSRDDYDAYLREQYFDRGIMSREDLVAGGHCLRPRFLADQIDRSRRNLGVECIDLYYLHNPEQQLDTLDRARFLSVLREAFLELESQVAAGRIAAYGCATWHGFRVFAAARNYLSLEEFLTAARDAGGSGHHFRAIQLPVNLAMTEAVRAPTQSANSRNLALLALARELGISVFASASLMQAQLARNLPDTVRSLFPLDTDAQRAIAFVRSLPVATALVGMRSIDHLTENLGAGRAVTQS